jgi:LPXTG-site transpeptidase (sortase) family protein
LKKVGGPVYEIRMESEYIKLYHSTAKISDYTHGILDDDSDVDYGYNVFSNEAYIKKYLEEFFPQMCNVLDAACNDPSATESITYTDVEVAKGIAPSNCYNVIRRTHYVDRVLDGKTYRFVAVLNIRLLHHNYAITYSGQMDTVKVKEGTSLPLPYNSINKLISSNPSFNLDAFMTNKLAISFVKDVESGAQEGIKIYTRTYKIYDKYIVEPKNVNCTSQLTRGKKEVTLITCTDNSESRVIVKARAV